MTKTKTLKNYKFQKTKNKNLFRLVDLNGNWRFYYYKPTKQYLRAVNYILDSGYAKGDFFYKWLKNISAEEADKILKYAGDRGDKVHKMISYLLNNKGVANRGTTVWNEEDQEEQMLSNDEWDYLLTFVTFWQAHEPIMVAEDYPVYRLPKASCCEAEVVYEKGKVSCSVCKKQCETNVGHAGTLDFIGILTKECDNPKCCCHKIIGKVGIWDWKTSSGIRDSYGAQVAAYAYSDNIKAFDYTAILRLGTKHSLGYEAEVYDKDKTKEHWNEFNAAITIQNACCKPFNPNKEIYEIPLTININVVQQTAEPKKAVKK